MRIAFAAFVLTACISNPTPHPGVEDALTDLSANEADNDTGDVELVVPPEDDSDSDSAPDTDPDSGDAATDDGGPDAPDSIAPTNAFPPADRTVVIRSLLVRDLDGDGAADLLIASSPQNDAQWGVYVFFDADNRSDFSHYDAFVQTAPIPDGLLVGTLIGATQNLIVFGQRGDRGLVEVYPLTARQFGAPLTLETPFVPAGGLTPTSAAPVGLAIANANGDSVPDLAVHDLDELQVVTPTAWSALGTEAAIWTPINSAEPWLAILNVAFLEGATPRVGDLVVSQQWGGVHYFEVSDSGLDLNDNIVATGVLQYGTALLDVDADGITDSLGFYDRLLSVRRFAPPTVVTSVLESMPLTGNRLDDLAAGDVDNSGTLDFVLLEESTANRSDVHVLRGITLTAGEIRSAAWRTTAMSLGQDPYRLTVLGPPSARRVWLFDLDGTPRCLAWSAADAALRPCP